MMNNKYKQFMLDSNRIEGEDRINPGDMKAIDYVLQGMNTQHEILVLHKLLGTYLQESWVGKYRSCRVTVGNHVPPNPEMVPHLMAYYTMDWNKMDSWEAHNKFEAIHPFQDLNGRVGRLLWLSKALNEGYNFGIPFLQMYYYQTLGRQK